MTIFLTGATGYIGSYVVNGLMSEHGQKLKLLGLRLACPNSFELQAHNKFASQ